MFTSANLSLSESWNGQEHIVSLTITWGGNQVAGLKGDGQVVFFMDGVRQNEQDFSVSINNQDKTSQTVVLYIKTCDGNHTNPLISASVYFTGTETSSGYETGSQHYADYLMGSIKETIVYTSHGSGGYEELILKCSLSDDHILSIKHNRSFPGNIISEYSILKIYTKENGDLLLQKDIDLKYSYYDPYTLNIDGLTNGDSIYVEVSSLMTEEEMGAYNYHSGSWKGTLEYYQPPSDGVKVYTKESGYTQCGILYVRTAAGYVKAKSFHVL